MLITAPDLSYLDLVDKVKGYCPAFVIAGSEPGVELSDRLSDSLGLVGNDPKTSLKRRNKFEMARAISEHGLNCAAQYLAVSENELISHVKKISFFPVVVKPVNAMGSEDVRVCFDEEGALEAFRGIYGKKMSLD
ncbi:MAG: hypothetical protein QM805_08785 [Pseudomonas sp.]